MQSKERRFHIKMGSDYLIYPLTRFKRDYARLADPGGNPGNTGLGLIDNGFDLFSYEPYQEY